MNPQVLRSENELREFGWARKQILKTEYKAQKMFRKQMKETK